MNDTDTNNEKNETEFCQQCPNHCAVLALKCGRGRKYFGVSTESEDRGVYQSRNESKRNLDSDSLYFLMRSCGHYLHHNNTEENSTVSMEEQLFSCLDEKEHKLLKELLMKLQKNWK